MWICTLPHHPTTQMTFEICSQKTGIPVQSSKPFKTSFQFKVQNHSRPHSGATGDVEISADGMTHHDTAIVG